MSRNSNMIIKPKGHFKHLDQTRVAQELMMRILADFIHNNVYYCLELEDLAHLATATVISTRKEIKFFIGGNLKIITEEFAFIRAFRYFLRRKNSFAQVIFSENPNLNSRFMQMLVEHQKENKNLELYLADGNQLSCEKYNYHFLLSDGKRFCYSRDEINLSGFARVKEDNDILLDFFKFVTLFINLCLGIKRPKDGDFLNQVFRQVKEKSKFLVYNQKEENT